MENQLRIGLVGIGGMGNLQIDCYAGMQDVEIVGLCDIVEGRAEAARKAHNLSEAVITCTDFHELITRDDIDAIDIATPNYMHPVIAIAAMKAGKHVFSEKPDCITVEQAEEMKTTSEQTGKVLNVPKMTRNLTAFIHSSAKLNLTERLMSKILRWALSVLIMEHVYK